MSKVTKDLKEMVLQALSKAGGVQYLTARALDPKTAPAFLALIGKVLPHTVNLGGADGKELSLTVTFEAPKRDA